MFGGRFSLSKFSLPHISKTKQRRLIFTESVLGSLGVGQLRPKSVFLSERITGTANLIRKFPRSLALSESAAANLNLKRLTYHRFALSEWAGASIRINETLHRTTRLELSAYGKSVLSRLYGRKAAFSAAVYTSVKLSKWMMRHPAFSEIVQGYFCVLSYRTQTLRINVVLKPGDELRIDSDTFTALLNQENVLHWHEGDWITASRELLDIIVRPGGGQPLSGSLIYTERFL